MVKGETAARGRSQWGIRDTTTSGQQPPSKPGSDLLQRSRKSEVDMNREKFCTFHVSCATRNSIAIARKKVKNKKTEMVNQQSITEENFYFRVYTNHREPPVPKKLSSLHRLTLCFSLGWEGLQTSEKTIPWDIAKNCDSFS